MSSNESGSALIKVSMPKTNHVSSRTSWRAWASVVLPELDGPFRTITSTWSVPGDGNSALILVLSMSTSNTTQPHAGNGAAMGDWPRSSSEGQTPPLHSCAMRVSTSGVTINAPRDVVWAVVTLPEYVRQWQYNSELTTDWIVGHP